MEEKQKNINIAIDGPAGAGKSTLSKMLAKELGYIYVDTGALYRAIGLFVLNHSISLEDDEKIIDVLKDINLQLSYKNSKQLVILNDEDVSSKIRTQEVSMAASKVSAIKEVRSFLLKLQKDMAANNSVVMDGRDIGTVILPNADIKIFLTASPEERAKRRHKELLGKGQNVNYQEVLDTIKKRDFQDSNRSVAPLKPADDSIIVDTTNYKLDASLDLLLECVKEHLKWVYFHLAENI